MTAVNSLATSGSSLYAAGRSERPKSPIDLAASLFGMTTSDLSAELKSGKSLNDVAKEKGISTDELDAALVKGMPPAIANSNDALAIAKKMAAEVGGPRAPRGGGGHHIRPAANDATGSASSSNPSNPLLDQLSSLLGTDSSTLKSSLTSGTSLSDLLSQKGISMSSLADSLQQGVLLDATV